MSEAEWAGLEPEIVRYEPRGALVAGPTGLEAIDALLGELALASSARRRSRSRSAPGRRAAVAELVRRAGFERVEIRRDLAGIERVVVGAGSSGHERRAAIDRDRLDRARRRRPPRAPPSTAASSAAASPSFPADGLYGLACDPMRADAIARIHRIKGRDDGKPAAVMYFSPLAMREVVSGLGPRTRDVARRLPPGPGDARRREPRAPLPARLPRGSGTARAAADRGPARRGGVRRLPDLGQPLRGAGAAPLRRRRPGDRRARATSRSTAASSPGCRRR